MAIPSNILAPRIRAAQVVVVVLLLSLAGFAALGYSVYLEDAKLPPRTRPPVVAYLGLGTLVFCTGLGFMLSGMIAPGMLARRQADPDPLADDLLLLSSYETVHVVGTALLLGPAFFCTLSLFAERHLWVLAGPALAVLLMLLRFPTCGRAQAWAERWRPLLDARRPRS